MVDLRAADDSGIRQASSTDSAICLCLAAHPTPGVLTLRSGPIVPAQAPWIGALAVHDVFMAALAAFVTEGDCVAWVAFGDGSTW
jgi:hypothetical protein